MSSGSSIYPEADRYKGNDKYLKQKEDNLRKLEEKERLKKQEERDKERKEIISKKLEELKINTQRELMVLENERSHFAATIKKINLKIRILKQNSRDEAGKIRGMFDTEE